jgi:hypothetical protein
MVMEWTSSSVVTPENGRKRQAWGNGWGTAAGPSELGSVLYFLHTQRGPTKSGHMHGPNARQPLMTTPV